MKRLVTYKELHYDFPGIKVMPHSTYDFDDNVEVRMSYKTALLYVNGQNIGSFYPKPTDNPEFWVSTIKEFCEDNGSPISEDKALDLAEYAINNVR